MATAYLAGEPYAAALAAELRAAGPVEQLGGRLFLQDSAPVPTVWAADVWFDVERLRVTSIGAAAAALRERAPWWCHLPGAAVRRGELIRARLPDLRLPALAVPPAKRLRGLAAYTLLDREELLLAPRTQRPFPLGVPELAEERVTPPSRAYRKLWEALLLLDRWPAPGESCWDLGASPGAWTWVLARLGARVLAVDKAPLAPSIAAMPGVTWRQGSAFALEPAADPLRWLCSDVICYPARLLGHVERWLAAGVERCIVTVKLQGSGDAEAVRGFQALPDSQLLHLHHNKHELTWIRHPGLRGPEPGPWPWLVEETVP